MKKLLLIFTLSLGSLWAASLDDLIGTYDFSGNITYQGQDVSVHGAMTIAGDGKTSLTYYYISPPIPQIKIDCQDNVAATLNDQGILQLLVNCPFAFLEGLLINLAGVVDFEEFIAPMNAYYAKGPSSYPWMDTVFTKRGARL